MQGKGLPDNLSQCKFIEKIAFWSFLWFPVKNSLVFWQLFHSYSDQVLVGNQVLVPQNDKLTPIEVKQVSHIIMQGD